MFWALTLCPTSIRYDDRANARNASFIIFLWWLFGPHKLFWYHLFKANLSCLIIGSKSTFQVFRMCLVIRVAQLADDWSISRGKQNIIRHTTVFRKAMCITYVFLLHCNALKHVTLKMISFHLRLESQYATVAWKWTSKSRSESMCAWNRPMQWTSLMKSLLAKK